MLKRTGITLKMQTVLLAVLLMLLYVMPGASAEDYFVRPGWPLLVQADDPLTAFQAPKQTPEEMRLWLLGISPDGETAICACREERAAEGNTETVYSLCMVRGGEIVPIVLNAERGNGDPYGALEELAKQLFSMANNGTIALSWTADSRYVTLSDIRRVIERPNFSLDVPVVDTVAGEAWLADSYERKSLLAEGFGCIYLSRMSRDGRYVYYTGLMNDTVGGEIGRFTRFCRCAVEGGEREILFNILYDGSFYEPLASSDLIEAADGSWLMQGRTRRTGESAIIRFRPEGDTWTAETIPEQPIPILSPEKIQMPASADTGIALLVNRNSMEARAGADGQNDIAALMPIGKQVNLMRIRSGEAYACDVWYMRRTGENPQDVEMIPGDESLAYLQEYAKGLEPETPESFDLRESMIHPVPNIFDACISPDGKYALLAVSMQDAEWRYGVYLLNLETMEVRPVSPAEGMTAKDLGNYVMYAQKTSGAQWLPDWTIMIPSGSREKLYFRLVARD